MSQRREPGELGPDDLTVVRRHGARVPRERPGKGPEGGEGTTSKSRSQAGDEDSQTSASTERLADAYQSDDTSTAIAEVMAADEGTRARAFSGVIGVTCLLILPVLPFLGGDPLAKHLCLIGVLLIGSVSLWVAYVARDPLAYTRRIHRLYGWCLVTSVLLPEYYLGVFSPVVILITLGIYYFGQSTDRRSSVIIPLVGILSFLALAGLTAFGLLEDRGLFSAEDAELSTKVFAIFSMTIVLGLTLRMAHIARASMLEAIRSSNEALMVAQRREALLAEAKHQLDRALRVAIGKPGRYTGQMANGCRLDVIVGVGAMGEIYAAEKTETGERIAVKLLPGDAADDERLFERFRRESEICLQLRHPNLVEVYEMGRLDHGVPYMAMELLEGEDLAARLRVQSHFSPTEVVAFAQDVAAGLQYAHDAGVIHRDLKPQNLFESVDKDGNRRWKILDFGISKLRSSSNTLTREGLVGTPGYMSPEQASAGAVDTRSDLFSLASVVYRALTGRPAFPGANTPQIMFDVVYKNPLRPSLDMPELPHDFDLVLALGLAKDRNRRFQSAPEFARALKAASEKRLRSELKARARELLKEHPWGQIVHGTTSG